MQLYCTTKNAGPAWGLEPVFMVYLGPSIERAEEAVKEFVYHEKPNDQFPANYSESFSAIPMDVERQMLKYYEQDGWWYTIVSFEIEPEPKIHDRSQLSLEI